MDHVGTVTKSSRLPNLPFHAQCSCGTAGTFPDKEQALGYLRSHGMNVGGQNLANTFKLVDDSDKPEVLPNRPLPHVSGVGNMPTTHAALGTDVTDKVPTPPEARMGVDLRGEQKSAFVPEGGAVQESSETADATDYSLPENWKKNRKK